MSDQKYVIPVAQQETNQCTVTPPWFVSKSEYNCLMSTVAPLVNGEEAFRAVHQAIAAAQKSVCIICWGFQPSMYFIRDGKHVSIGQLLEEIGNRVSVKILSYAVDPLWLGINVTSQLPGESNLPGRRVIRLPDDRPATSTDEQYDYDFNWYLRNNHKRTLADHAGKIISGRDGKTKASQLQFVTRGFSAGDRVSLGRHEYTDKGLSKTAKGILAAAPSHHQKMVLVDYEDPKTAVGFVMGHNMLDEYWDTDQHTYYRHYYCQHGKPEPQPYKFPNGKKPRQDISSKLTGPVIGDLFHNFAQAWKKETNETLPTQSFDNYPYRKDEGTLAACLLLRTQPQYKVEDIKKTYLQAVNNATQYIYIENQYFRWPPLAEKILAAAKVQTSGGRKPEEHGSLYLFVITNADDEGIGPGIMNTYRMLDSLGRSDTIPAVARKKETDIRDQNVDLAKARQNELEQQVDQSARRQWGHFGNDHMALLGQANEARDATVQAQKERDATEVEIAQAKKSGKERTIRPKSRPGLKVHICTLVAPDSPDRADWLDVYIHAKLMLIDDAFMTVGSANINTRSMEVDSELNIALDRPEITRPLRQRLWGLHTKGEGTQDSPKEAFRAWDNLIKKNQDRRAKQLSPLAPLIEFFRSSQKISDKD